MAKRKTSLLAQAQGVQLKRKRGIASDEEIEVALAWLRDEVSILQIWRARHPENPNKTSGSANVLYRVAVSLRTAYDNGQLKIVDGR